MTNDQRKIRPHATPKPAKAKPPKATANERQLQRFAALEFNYAQIEDEHQRGLMQQAASDIRARLRRSIADMIEIGQQLREIQEILDYGRFYDWAQTEFGLSRGSIFEFIQIYARFAEKRSIIERFFSPTIVRRLAAVSVPDDAVTAVIEAAQANGKRLRVQDAMAIVKPYLPPKQRQPKQLPGPVAAEPDPETITAEYSVMEPQLSFDAWLAAIPTGLGLREQLAILTLAKATALHALGDHPKLYNAVYGALPTWSQLITAIERELKK